jgi:Cu/Ag efflux protein CusF
MNRLLFPTLLAIAAFATPAIAHDEHAGHGAMHMAPTQAAPQPTLIDGEVKKVDKAAGTITVAHGALPNGMPGMTMGFKVSDKAWLDTVRAGQRIRFASDSINGALTITRLDAAK